MPVRRVTSEESSTARNAEHRKIEPGNALVESRRFAIVYLGLETPQHGRHPTRSQQRSRCQ